MIRHVVTDVEGTTTPVAFVRDVLFPFARARLAGLVRARREEPEVRAALDATRALLGDASLDDEAVVAALVRWADEDRKATPLKALQGLAWEAGYADGTLVAPVYDDVPVALRAWRGAGRALHVYSSGSVRAQRLLFAHTTHGDLGPLFTRYFDTELGPKKDASSYAALARALDAAPGDVLFLSDSAAELDAADAAGLATVGVVRDGAAAPRATACVTTFADVDALVR